MLQAGFGFDPLQSGLTTLGAAAGAIAMKFLAPPALRIFGFRATLVWNAVLSALSIAVCALFTPATPVWIIFAVLLLGGVFRSLEFTALNSIAYADLRQEQMSGGTAFAALVQQLSLSMGIALSAVTLDLLRLWGVPPEGGGFRIAFVLVGAIVLVSALHFAMLPRNAGSQLVGRGGQGKSTGTPGPGG